MAKKKTNKQPWSSSLESREALYKGVNPSADFDPISIATQTVGYLGGFRTGHGMPEDEARWAAYLGLPYDKTYAPDTKIRFEGDENYPDRQYQGLSKRAKNEVRKKIIPQAKRIKDKYNKEWIQVLDTKPNSEYNDATIYHDRQNYLGDLGKFGIREVGESGIYEVGDKYDFPALIPIPDRNEGTELMVRDTIWSDRANPKLYNQEVIKRKNKYSLGSWFKGAAEDIKNWNEGITNKLMGSNFGQGLSNLGIKAGGLGGVANTAATAIGGALAGGRTTGVGNALQGIGSLASNIPGVGGLIGAGVNLIGGLTNAAFGSKLNAENIAAVEGDIKQALNFTSNASDYDALASNYAGLQGVMGFDKDFIGKDGWIGGSKAKRKYNELKRRAEEAEQFQFNTLTNNAQNIADTNLQLLEANYNAYGGPIDMKYTGVMSTFGNQFKDGGIYIKPSKRGTFTAAAKKRGMGVQEFAGKVLANKEDYSPAMVKKANFARNASKWKHDDGGPLDTRMELLRRLEEKRNRRGTYGGGKHGGGGAGSLFLESPDDFTLVKDTIWVPYRETFNDAFGRARAAGLDEFMFDGKAYTTELGDNPDNNRAGEERVIEGLLPVERTRQVKNKKAEGGELFTNGVTIIGNGGTHESNPYEGVQMGVDPQGIPNLVEEGEVVFNDYVFSNRLIVPDAVREKYKLRGNKELTFADAAKQVQKESKERPNDPISKRGLMSAMSRLQQEQEAVREEKQASQEGRQYAKGGRLGNLFAGPGEESQEMNNESNLTWLRYAPVVGSAIGLGQNLFSNPDYSGPNAILSAAESAGRYTPVGYSPIGNYLKYNPFDRDFYINKLNAQAGATRRATTNTSGGNRAAAMAGILASDYNYGNQLGALARQAEEYNLAQRQAVEQFNRATNMTNAEMGLKAAMANQEAAMKAAQQRLAGTTQAMNMREEIAARRGAGISANLTNFFNSLGEIGREEYSRNMIMSNPALYYSIDSKGNITYKNGYEDLSEAEKKEVRTAASKAKSKKAKGGYLTIKKGGRHG